MQNLNSTKKELEEQNSWDEEQMDSQPEITLVRFNDSFDYQNQISHSLSGILEQYSVEDRKNFIIDRTNGKVIDLRQQNFYDSNSHFNSKITQNLDNFWDDHWQESERIHQKLLMAICQKNSSLLEQLFNKRLNPIPINVNYKSFDNWTPLHFASMHGNIEAIEILLNSPEVFIDALTNFKWSALHVSVKNNKIDAVQMLIKAKINPDYQDEDGYTALHYAVQCGYRELIKMLIGYEANLSLKTHKGHKPEDLCTCSSMMKLFRGQNEHGIFYRAKNNRFVEKILMNFHGGKVERKKQDIPHPEIHKNAENVQRQGTQRNSKKDNIVKMYQLLKESKKNKVNVSLASFKFYKKIGEGAFGEVYIVKKDNSPKLYALKAIKKEKVIGTNLNRYIQTEKDVLSLICHPFIVRLHYAFQTETYLFLVMDYCQGGDLGKMLEKYKKFDQKTVKKYAAEILLGVEALHRERIIYRDLKPQNIVLNQDGHALLTDFGLSKKTNSLDELNKSFCGTPAYLPLEIINKKGHTRMVDWYQFGVVLYELYAGIPPFYAETRTQLYQNVKTGIIRFPRGTPELFRDFIKKLLAQKPQKRLGYEKDAQSVKQHQWFCDIDWEDVYNQKLQMPAILKKKQINQPIKTRFSNTQSSKYRMSNWTFIGE